MKMKRGRCAMDFEVVDMKNEASFERNRIEMFLYNP